MTTYIETYLNSLSEDILKLHISGKNIKSLPDLTKFKNLEILYCHNNQLTSLPTLPQNLKELNCHNNQLTSLPTLPQNLEKLVCSYNQLISLPTLPQNLENLVCFHNQLTSLPTLPQNLENLYCSNNQLTSLPTLPQNLKELYCYHNQLTSLRTLPEKIVDFYYSGNPICNILDNNSSLIKIKQNIKILNNFRYLYYSLQFKKQLIKWLWKSKEKEIMEKYHPKYLLENLKEDTDLDEFLNNW